jgi:hypothetical protein
MEGHVERCVLACRRPQAPMFIQPAVLQLLDEIVASLAEIRRPDDRSPAPSRVERLSRCKHCQRKRLVRDDFRADRHKLKGRRGVRHGAIGQEFDPVFEGNRDEGAHARRSLQVCLHPWLEMPIATCEATTSCPNVNIAPSGPAKSLRHDGKSFQRVEGDGPGACRPISA